MRRRGQGSSWIRRDRRLMLYALDGWRCVYCARFAFPDGRLGLDHLVPQCLDGDTSSDNLLTCCWRCNTLRHTLPAESFASALADEAGLCVSEIADRVAAARARRRNTSRMAALRTRARAWVAACPAWLVALRKRCSNAARADGVDGERHRRRLAEAERWDDQVRPVADDDAPTTWTDDDLPTWTDPAPAGYPGLGLDHPDAQDTRP